MFEFYLTCPRGLEEVLQKELNSYLKQDIYIDKGGVSFKGSKEDMYRVNYKTRIGMNLHMKLFDEQVSNYDDIYKSIYKTDLYKSCNCFKNYILKFSKHNKISKFVFLNFQKKMKCSILKLPTKKKLFFELP